MLFLASKSHTRIEILCQVGIPFRVLNSDFDEESAKTALMNLPLPSWAQQLSDAKALSAFSPEVIVESEDYVLAGDQILLFEDCLLNKPLDTAAARQQLMVLRGQTHQLISTLSIAYQGEIVWKDKQIAELTMREFSNDFLDHYLETAADKVLHSVGGYQREGLGAQLFESIVGDFHTILGLPTENLLRYLRKIGYLMS